MDDHLSSSTFGFYELTEPQQARLLVDDLITQYGKLHMATVAGVNQYGVHIKCLVQHELWYIRRRLDETGRGNLFQFKNLTLQLLLSEGSDDNCS